MSRAPRLCLPCALATRAMPQAFHSAERCGEGHVAVRFGDHRLYCGLIVRLNGEEVTTGAVEAYADRDYGAVWLLGEEGGPPRYTQCDRCQQDAAGRLRTGDVRIEVLPRR